MSIIMYDSIDPSQIPSDAQAAAGYTSGNWPTYPTLVKEFPHAHLLSIAVNASHDADTLDIETGDATVADAPVWTLRQKARGVTRPVLYCSASTMAELVGTIGRAGIARSSVRLWSAHYTGTAHLCGPDSCGATSVTADGTQYTNAALGRNLDASLLADSFFGAAPAPAPASNVQVWVCQGQKSLAELAAEWPGNEASTVLRLTCENSPGRVFSSAMASYVNGVLGADTLKVPQGVRLLLGGTWFTATGHQTLQGIALDRGLHPAGILQATVEGSAGEIFAGNLANYLNSVFQRAASGPKVPAGVHLYYEQ